MKPSACPVEDSTMDVTQKIDINSSWIHIGSNVLHLARKVIKLPNVHVFKRQLVLLLSPNRQKNHNTFDNNFFNEWNARATRHLLLALLHAAFIHSQGTPTNKPVVDFLKSVLTATSFNHRARLFPRPRLLLSPSGELLPSPPPPTPFPICRPPLQESRQVGPVLSHSWVTHYK